jgi:P pilus assembly chaperone PapD
MKLNFQLLVCLCSYFWMTNLFASLEIYPVRLDLTTKSPISSFVLSNNGDKKINIQANLVSWDQVDGKNVYKKMNDGELFILPLIFSIAANSSQVVRVGLPKPKDELTEKTYRVIFKEFIPRALAVKKLNNDAANISFLFMLNISIPIFIAPAVPKPIAATFIFKPKHKGFLPILINNRGNTHIHLVGIKLRSGDNIIAESNAVLYILAGKSMIYRIEVNPHLLKRGKNITISAKTDDEATPILTATATIH